MVVLSSFSEGLTKAQVEQILNQTINPLKEILDKFIERDEVYKRKLLLTISEMHQRQELNLEGHDRLKAFLDEWFGKE